MEDQAARYSQRALRVGGQVTRIGVVMATRELVEENPDELAVALEGAEVLDRVYRPGTRTYEYTIRHHDLDPIPEGSVAAPFYVVEMRKDEGYPARRVKFERI